MMEILSRLIKRRLNSKIVDNMIAMSNYIQQGQALLIYLVSIFSTSVWNIQGMNQFPKQKEVQNLIHEFGVNVCAILESHIQSSKLHKICNLVFGNWKWMANYQLCHKGTRIIVGWNPNVADVMLLSQLDQVIHCQVILILVNKSFFC